MSNSDKQKLVFLLGSGISYKAGMPKLNEITERVCTGEGIFVAEKISQYISPLISKKRSFQKWLPFLKG